MNNNDEIIVLRTYTNMAAAISAQEVLTENGIAATVDDMDVMGLSPLEGVELRVFDKDVRAALDLIGPEETEPQEL